MARNYANDPDVYELVLIRPIKHANSVKQARARARSARIKLGRHEKATQMGTGEALNVLDRITDAERRKVVSLIEQQAVHQYERDPKPQRLREGRGE